MSKIKVLSLAALFALSLAVNAQPAAQDWEVILGGNVQAKSDFGTGGFGATLSLGYYLNENMEGVIRQSLNYAGKQATGATRVGFDYNLIMDKLVPFIGANVGFNYGNNRYPETWGFGPEVGLKYYLQSKAFLFGMAEFQMPFEKRTFHDGNWLFTLGLGVDL